MGAEFTTSEKRSDEGEINADRDWFEQQCKVGTKRLGKAYLNNDWRVRQSLWLIDSAPVPGSLLWQAHASMAENAPPGVRVPPITSSWLCGSAIKHKNYLKALQEHMSSQFTRLLSWSPGHRTRTFCSLTKRSRFGSKSIHEGEAKLYQTLSHMIPTKHAARTSVRSHINVKKTDDECKTSMTNSVLWWRQAHF